MVAPTTTNIPVQEDARTFGEITDDQLVLMALDVTALSDEYQGFEEVAIGVEANLDLARKTLQDPSDEANDIATLGRTSGARAELRPRSVRVGAGDLVTLHSWVSLFENDQGARAYLLDFVQDAAKGVGGGIPDDLEVTSAESFAVDAIEAQTVGLVITETIGDGFERYQTVIGLRLGRVLGFVALVHGDDGDRRLRAIQLAETLAERMDQVLSGELVPPEPPPVLEPLDAYAFEYRQRIDKGASDATIIATGVDIVGQALDCRLRFDLDGLIADRRYIIVGTSAQVLDQDAEVLGWEDTSRDAFNTASDLIYCPGWPVELLASGLDVVLAGRPITETTIGGVEAISYELDFDAAVAIGFVPEGTSIDVDLFSVVVDAVNPWTRSLALELSGSARAFADAFGKEFTEFEGNSVSVAISFTATSINDPALVVEAP